MRSVIKNVILIISLIYYPLVSAQIINIPDTNFKNALLNHFPVIDTNSDGEIQVNEAENVTQIHVDGKSIDSLDGIQSFVNLTRLFCSHNNLTNLDLSGNTNLKRLDCYDNNLVNLNIGSNVQLEALFCHDNNLSSLNLNSNEFLLYLDLSSNEFINLDLSSNLELRYLFSQSNRLMTLDLSNNTDLYYLDCSHNKLHDLDLSQNGNLEKLFCNDNYNLNSINIQNGNNANFYISPFPQFDNLTNLSNVCVDELNTSLTNLISSQVEQLVAFSTDCRTLSLSSDSLLDFEIYPNPASNVLNIRSDIEVGSVHIFNNIGQLVLFVETTDVIDISNLNQGLYICKVVDQNGNFGIKKVIKN